MLFTETDQFSGNKNCDAICTFDHECQFDEVCQNRECVKDDTFKWQCSTGLFDSPEKACRRVKPSKGILLLKFQNNCGFFHLFESIDRITNFWNGIERILNKFQFDYVIPINFSRTKIHFGSWRI